MRFCFALLSVGGWLVGWMSECVLIVVVIRGDGRDALCGKARLALCIMNTNDINFRLVSLFHVHVFPVYIDRYKTVTSASCLCLTIY